MKDEMGKMRSYLRGKRAVGKPIHRWKNVIKIYITTIL